MPELHNGEAKLHFEAAGAGELVVLVHGGFADYRLWTGLTGVLSKKFRVVSYSRRGYHPYPAQLEEGTNFGTHSADLSFLISRLSDEPVRLVAESYGACVATGFALRNPSKVRSMVIDEPPLLSLLRQEEDLELSHFENDVLEVAVAQYSKGNVQQAAQTIIDFLEGSQVYDSLPGEVKAAIGANASATFSDLRGGLDGIDPSELHGLKTPALLLKSELGPSLLKRTVDRYAEMAPTCEVKIVEGTSHGSIVDSPRYRTLVEDFLSRN